MAKFAVIVTTSPYSNYTATAIDVVKAITDSGNEVLGVFFYQDGVLNANSYTAIPQDEFQSHSQWIKLQEEQNIPLHLCITAAEKRGMSDDALTNNIGPHFTISGLGELVELTNSCDRVLQL